MTKQELLHELRAYQQDLTRWAAGPTTFDLVEYGRRRGFAAAAEGLDSLINQLSGEVNDG